MTPKAPILDVFVGRDGERFRLYSAPRSWRTPFHRHMDERGDIFPVGRPDVADLDQFMWESDSPFERRPTTDGGGEILARGRSAVTLVVWLAELIAAGPAPYITDEADATRRRK
jgi:hypothetical protein